MPSKPNSEQILNTYTQQELADLYKEKVLRDSQEQIEIFKQGIADLNQLFQGDSFSVTSTAAASKKRGPKPKAGKLRGRTGAAGVRRGRPAKSSTESAGENGGGESRQALGSILLSVLKKKPMKIEEILEKVHEKGWSTKSSKPRTLISQELTKQLKKGTIEKADRGSYKKL